MGRFDNIKRFDSQRTIEQLKAENERLKLDVKDNVHYRDEAVINLDRAEKAEAENVLLREAVSELLQREFRAGGMKIEQARIHAETRMLALNSTLQTAKVQSEVESLKKEKLIFVDLIAEVERLELELAKAQKAEIFVDHIQKHLAAGESVVCKICNKDIDTIYKAAERAMEE